MSQLSPNARRLLELARHEDVPSAALEARLERSLARRIALGGAAAGGTAGAGSASGVAASTKVLFALGVVAMLGGGAWVGMRQLRSADVPAGAAIAPKTRLAETSASVNTESAVRTPLPTPAAEPRASKTTASANTGIAANGLLAAPVGELATPAGRVASASTADPAPPTRSVEPAQVRPSPNTLQRRETRAGLAPSATEQVDFLQAETSALRDAQQALRSGNAERALDLLEQQDHVFALGALQEERAAARVLALCQAFGPAGVTGEAARFEQRYPRSALLGRVRAACRDQRGPATQRF